MNQPEIEFTVAPTALYRLYDAKGVLLYVGISRNLRLRMMQHAADKAWWRKVARKTLVWYGTRAEALVAERVAIRDGRPVYNVIQTDGRVMVKRVEHWAAWEQRAMGLPAEDISYWIIDCPFCRHEHGCDPEPGIRMPDCRGGPGYMVTMPGPRAGIVP